MPRMPWERAIEKQRLERTAGGARTFWEVSSNDRTVEERWGDVGGKARKRSGTFPTADAAEAEVARLIAAKRAEGFAPLAAPPAPTPIVATKRLVNAEREAALAETPEDVAAWQVYGDWLTENGEAWGEVIGLATQGKATTLHRAAAEKAWFGTTGGLDLNWAQLGVVRTAELRPSPAGSAKLVAGLAKMFAHPGGRLVQYLTIELPETEMTFQPIIDAIVAAGLPLLKLLALHRRGHAATGDTPIADLGALWAAVPRIEWLQLDWFADVESGTPCILGDISSARHLKTLRFRGCGLPGELAIALGAAELPNVTHLELVAGPVDHGSTITLASLAGLLAGRSMPKLETLMLFGLDFEAGLVEAFARSPLVAQLTSLWLVDGVLHEPSARGLAEHADAFQHLTLTLHDNYFSAADLALIGERIPHIETYRQRDPVPPLRPNVDHDDDDSDDDDDDDDDDE